MISLCHVLLPKLLNIAMLVTAVLCCASRIAIRLQRHFMCSVCSHNKPSNYSPGQELGAPEYLEAPRIYTQYTYDCGNVVKPMLRPSLTIQGIARVLISVRNRLDPRATLRTDLLS